MQKKINIYIDESQYRFLKLLNMVNGETQSMVIRTMIDELMQKESELVVKYKDQLFK